MKASRPSPECDLERQAPRTALSGSFGDRRPHRRAAGRRATAAIKADIVLTKSEISAIHIPIGGIYSGSCLPGGERPWLSEPLLNHNPPRELEAEGIFPLFSLATL
jgi:hypothetical protein